MDTLLLLAMSSGQLFLRAVSGNGLHRLLRRVLRSAHCLRCQLLRRLMSRRE